VVWVHSIIAFLSGTAVAANDVIELAVLPAGFALVDYRLWSVDDWDTNGTPTLAARVGLMTGAPGDAGRALGTVGSEFRAAAVIFNSAQTAFEASTLITSLVAATTADRSIGMGITVSAATNPSATRTLNCMLAYTPLRGG
jgi:hypothetical protein